MVEFTREVLEVTKYSDLVKLAKKHDVWRRYALKTELIDKLMALCETTVEAINDVSIPSFMANDESVSDEDECDAENTLPLKSSVQDRKGTNVHLEPREVSYSSPRVPLLDQGKNLNCFSSVSDSDSPTVKCRLRTTKVLEKSLAKPSFNDQKQKRQGTFELENISTRSAFRDQPTTRRLTRTVQEDTGHKMKREGTFDVESKVEKVESGVKKTKASSLSQTKKLRREGTFEITEVETSPEEKPSVSQSSSLKREGTFEIENSSITRRPSGVLNSATLAVPPRSSMKSPCQMKRNSTATPGSVRSAFKSRIPSVVKEIEKKKSEVSAKKIAEASGKKPVRKIPDFSAIHKKIFHQMESLVDARQRVVDRALSMQKSQQKSCTKRSPPNRKVARKILLPEDGKHKLAGAKSRLPTLKSQIPTAKSKLPTPKSKIPTPKPKLATPKSTLPTPRTKAAFQRVASEYASNIKCIQKRPSIGSLIPGVSKLYSPKFEARGNFVAGTSQFGCPKMEPSRKEAMKASVMGKKPVKRSSPMAKAKQALHSVRLNKRFELQMKHRLAQQEQGL